MDLEYHIDHMDLKDLMDHMDLEDHMDHMDLKDHMDLEDLMDPDQDLRDENLKIEIICLAQVKDLNLLIDQEHLAE